MTKETQLNRMEDKVDAILKEQITNTIKINTHMVFDKYMYKVLALTIVFVFTIHATDAIAFIRGFL